MESLSENQNYASEAEAFLNLKQHLQLDECMSAKSRYVEDLTGTDFKFKEDFYYTSVYHTLKNGLKTNQVCVQYQVTIYIMEGQKQTSFACYRRT